MISPASITVARSEDNTLAATPSFPAPSVLPIHIISPVAFYISYGRHLGPALTIDGQRPGPCPGQARPAGGQAGTAHRASRAVPLRATCLAFGQSRHYGLFFGPGRPDKHGQFSRPCQSEAHSAYKGRTEGSRKKAKEGRREGVELEVPRPALRARGRCGGVLGAGAPR